MSLFHLIQETAREQREHITRIEENIGKNTDLLKETNEKLTKDVEQVIIDVKKNQENIQEIKAEINGVKETVDPANQLQVEEQAKSAKCLAERNLTEVDINS